jgi:hypothetical protein
VRRLVALALLLTACAGGGGGTAPDDVTRDAPLGRNSWNGARLTDDPNAVLVTFVGGAPYRSGGPCTVRYAATATETASRVTVHVTATSPRAEGGGGTACNAIGYPRSVLVRLDDPLGDRALVDGFGRRWSVYRGPVHQPSWLPPGYRYAGEQAAPPSSWARTFRWGEPLGPSAACIGRPSIEVMDGLARMTAPDVEVRDHPDVRGAAATFRADPTGRQAQLEWKDGEHLVSLTTFATCTDDEPLDEATLLRVARGLNAG